MSGIRIGEKVLVNQRVLINHVDNMLLTQASQMTFLGR